MSGRVQRRQQAKFAAKDQAAQAQQEPAQPAYEEASAAQAAPAADPMEQLKSLGELKAQGVLTEAEFEAQKAKILSTI
ncbi:SHOCT domain-containing protein [Salinibacterium sp. ZJ450]|uniref:SHOCT domain-containing protein n=1 Tax=Salinibacterium sp. ZJ450 TaxID=2708338 RepID=UPI00351D6F47